MDFRGTECDRLDRREGDKGGRETTDTRLSPLGTEVANVVVARLVGCPGLAPSRPRRRTVRTDHRPRLLTGEGSPSSGPGDTK